MYYTTTRSIYLGANMSSYRTTFVFPPFQPQGHNREAFNHQLPLGTILVLARKYRSTDLSEGKQFIRLLCQ